MKVNKQSVLSSLFWKFLERGGSQVIQFIVQLILARLLTPEAFGTIAIVQVFIALGNVFIQRGFSTSLIQKKHSDELDFSSVFYASLFMAFAIYILLFVSAPMIGRFYSNPSLVFILRILGLNLFSGALNSVQNSYIAKQMMFKKLFRSSLIAGLLSGAVGILLAYNGFGIWSLVFQQLINQYTVAVVLMVTIRWRPHFIFSFTRLKELFSFGSNLLISSLIDTLYGNVRTLIIGRIYSPETLGYHDKGRAVPFTLTSTLNGTLNSVMLPTYAEFQDDQVRLKNIVRKSMMASSFLVFPMMIGLAAIAEPLVIFLLTETWRTAIPFIQIYSLSMMFLPIHTNNLQAINAIGRSDIFLKLEIVKKIIGMLILVISLRYGVIAIAVSSIVTTIVSAFINAYPNRTFLQYGYREQLSDLLPAFLTSGLMGIMVYLMNYLTIPLGLKLLLQIVSGAVLYFTLAKLFKLEILEYLLSTSREFLKQRK